VRRRRMVERFGIEVERSKTPFLFVEPFSVETLQTKKLRNTKYLRLKRFNPLKRSNKKRCFKTPKTFVR
jgi:hypothetical protein